MTYFALYDNQNHCYMHTGRNETKLNDLADNLRAYYASDHAPEDTAVLQRMDAHELADYGDFTIVSSNIPFNDGSEF